MNKRIDAMAFFHANGFVPAYEQTRAFAGKEGRVATLVDIIDARLAVPPEKELNQFSSDAPTPWDQYYTTMSAEYVGLTKAGTKVLIVAHGIGPMKDAAGVRKAYMHEFKDKSRQARGGRITAEEFHALESGKYGEVAVVDFEDHVRRYEYPFIESITSAQALDDPLVRARLGPRAQEYIRTHARFALKWHKLDAKDYANYPHIVHPKILKMGDASNCPYAYRKLNDGEVLAHLLTIGQITNLRESGGYPVSLWHSDISAHEWWNGTRLVGVRPGVSTLGPIVQGPNAHKLLRRKWQQLMEPSGITELDGFFALVEMPDKVWFTQVDKAGEGMDTYEPEFRVVSIEPMGEPVRFFTDVRHYHGFFKYGKSEVQAVMPSGANAYALVGEPENIWEGGNPVRQTCLAQPYRVVIDPTKRLVRQDALANDFERMMQLLEAA